MKKLFVFLGVALFLFANDSRHFANQTVTAGSSLKLNIAVDQPANKRVTLHYRTNAADVFKTKSLRNLGFDFSGEIKIPEEGYTELEYYFSIVDRFGNAETLPAINPEARPYSSRIVKYKQDANIIYEILAPFEGEEVEQDDFMIALSLLSVPADVNLKMTKVLFDGVNVTQFTEVDEEIITWVPVNRLKDGPHNIEVEFYNGSNELVKKIEWSFSINGDSEGGTIDDSATEAYRLYGSVDFNTSSQTYGQEGADPASASFTNTSVNLGGNLFNVDFTAFALFSSEQSDIRQNANRLNLNLRFNLFWGMYLDAKLGDFTPDYNTYMISGQNVKGYGVGLVTGLVNLQLTQGANRKEILPVDTLNDPSRTEEATFNQSFERTFTAGRFSIGKRERGFAIGINFLHSEDQQIAADSTAGIMDINPETNLVLGPDFTLGFMQNRIKFSVGALVSIKNENTRGGALPLETINEQFGTDLDQATYDQVNEVFPFNNIPIISNLVFSTFDWNYANVLLKVRYERIAADFKNHGNPYIQDDVKRLVANTTIRLLDNSIYLRAGLVNTEDNVDEKQNATTTDDNFNVGFDWYPAPSLPSISVGFRAQDQKQISTDSITLGDELGDYTNNSFDVRVSKGLNIAGFETNSMVLFGSGTAESKITPTLGSETTNMILNSSVKFPFLPLKVFAEFNTFDVITTDVLETKTRNLRLNGTYELLSTDNMSLSGFAQYINSATEQSDLVNKVTGDLGQNAFEFGGNFNMDLTSTIAMSSFVRFKTISISAETEDYSNSYFSLGASLNF